MLTSFKKTILTSYSISAIASAVVCSGLAVGVAHAAPDFGQVFPAQTITLPKVVNNVATPMAGHLGRTLAPVLVSTNNDDKYDFSYGPDAAKAIMQIDAEAQPAVVPQAHLAMNTATAENKAASGQLATIGSPVLVEYMAFYKSPTVRVAQVKPSAKFCQALDAKLDYQHLKPSREHAILAKHGCGSTATGSIEG